VLNKGVLACTIYSWLHGHTMDSAEILFVSNCYEEHVAAYTVWFFGIVYFCIGFLFFEGAITLLVSVVSEIQSCEWCYVCFVFVTASALGLVPQGADTGNAENLSTLVVNGEYAKFVINTSLDLSTHFKMVI